MTPRIALHLARHADSAWAAVVRPWLEAGRGRLERTHVVVPTRGQAQALKQRCLTEGLPLLGVELLTPGLARKKWMALGDDGRPALGREFLLVGLRALIEERLASLTSDDPAWGLWKSLQSDPEGALENFDELLKAGFRAADFPLAPLGEIFGELTTWTESLGATLAPLQAEAAALTPVPLEAARIAGRLLVLGLGVEAWGEFFNVAALARRCDDITVVLPEPELRGAQGLDEAWIDLWEKLLGVEAQALDASEPEASCGGVAALWTGDRGSAARAKLLVGQTRADEMALVADEIARRLAAGAESMAVVFPAADAAHLRLARLLAARGVPFADLLETAGALPIELQIQRALLAFYERGGRLEELLALWPLLHALNFVREPLAVARDVCERLFDETQSHALAAGVKMLASSKRTEWREVSRVATLLLPAWPAELTLADALARFGAVTEKFLLAPPDGWPALAAFAAKDPRPLPARVIFAALGSFLPDKSPVASAPGRSGFARVTLTTLRRAAGVAWSHTIFVESNAGVWPMRCAAGVWLTDEQRRALNARGRFSLGLFTSDDRAALEKQLYVTLARDTREQVIFSAALFDEEEPEVRLAPNAWVERVLMAGAGEVDFEAAFARWACAVNTTAPTVPVEPSWFKIWQRRRNRELPFDDFFFCGPPAVTRPARLAARLIERGVQDPAELWFEAVLGVRRVAWTPLVRARKKSLGQLAHRLLAEALRGVPAEGIFMERPAPTEARARLAETLAVWRKRWPRDRYWDSFHAELGGLASALLERVATLDAGKFVAVEASLPDGTEISLGTGETLVVHGRMDLALLDRPAWSGATVAIVDFKTGQDLKLTAERMARGASLQLGVYLAAVQSLGAAEGRVWMVKPDAPPASVEMDELPLALTPLAQLGRHLTEGRYGALTRDRSRFSSGGEWPLACTPIRSAVLARKFEQTFQVAVAAHGEEDGDE